MSIQRDQILCLKLKMLYPTIYLQTTDNITRQHRVASDNECACLSQVVKRGGNQHSFDDKTSLQTITLLFELNGSLYRISHLPSTKALIRPLTYWQHSDIQFYYIY